MNSRLDDEYEQWLLQAQAPKRAPGKKGKGDRNGKVWEIKNLKLWLVLGGVFIFLLLAYRDRRDLLPYLYSYPAHGFKWSQLLPYGWNSPTAVSYILKRDAQTFLFDELPPVLNICLALVIAVMLFFPDMFSHLWGILWKTKWTVVNADQPGPAEKGREKVGWIALSWLAPIPLFFGFAGLTQVYGTFHGQAAYLTLSALLSFGFGLACQRKGNGRHLGFYLFVMILLYPVILLIADFLLYFHF